MESHGTSDTFFFRPLNGHIFWNRGETKWYTFLCTNGRFRVMWCQVSQHSLTPPFVERIVMWCKVSHHSHSLTPPFIECIVMWCQVSHHSLSPAFVSFVECSVSHHCLTPPFIECILMWCKVTTLPSSPLLFVTTSLPHHFSSSPLPLVTASQSHHTPFVTTSLPHHFPKHWHSPCNVLILMWCQVSHHSLTPPFIECIVMWCQVSWVYCYVM